MKIAIVGFGASGVSVLRQLIDNKDAIPFEKIYIIQEESRQFAKGLPYQPDHDSLILNTQPHAVSLDTDKTTEFLEFLEKHHIDFDLGDFLPRPLFGQYINEVYHSIRDKDPEIDIEIVNQELVAINLNDEDYQLTLASGDTLSVQSVQLAIGHLAYNDPYDLEGTPNYFHNPYPIKDKLTPIKKDDKLAIVGAGLSALDFVVYLLEHRNHKSVDIFSLEGIAKTPRGLNYQYDIKLKYTSAAVFSQMAGEQNGQLQASDIFEAIRQEAIHHGVKFDYFWYEHESGTIDSLDQYLNEIDQLNILQTIIIAFKNEFNPTWNNYLSEDEKSRFMDDYNTKLTLYGAPIPEDRAKDLVKYSRQGHLAIYSDMSDVQINADGQFMITAGEKTYGPYDYLINASGQGLNITKTIERQTPLIQQLVSDGLAETYSFGGFKVDYPSFSLMHPELGKLDTFKVFGQLSSGIDRYNNSIEKLTMSTKQGAQALAHYYKNK